MSPSRNCGLPYYLGGEIEDRAKLLVATPELFAQRFRIDVRTRQEVMAIDRAAKTVTVQDHTTGRSYAESYDKLILAPGASPIVPPMPGAQARGVFTLRNLEDTDRIASAMPHARRVVVVGGGFIGLEVAEQFCHRGLEVSLVEMQPQVLPLLDTEMAEPLHRGSSPTGCSWSLAAESLPSRSRTAWQLPSSSPTGLGSPPTSSCLASACART